jgi:hypothetical protein
MIKKMPRPLAGGRPGLLGMYVGSSFRREPNTTGKWLSIRKSNACKLGLEGVVSKRKDSAYRSGRSPDWLKMKNPSAPALKREAEEDWGRKKWR